MLSLRVLMIEHRGNEKLVPDTDIINYEVRLLILASLFDGFQLVGVWRTTDKALFERIRQACQMVYDRSPVVELEHNLLRELGAIKGYDVTEMPDYDTVKPFLRRMTRVVPPYVEDGDE